MSRIKYLFSQVAWKNKLEKRFGENYGIYAIFATAGKEFISFSGYNCVFFSPVPQNFLKTF